MKKNREDVVRNKVEQGATDVLLNVKDAGQSRRKSVTRTGCTAPTKKMSATG